MRRRLPALLTVLVGVVLLIIESIPHNPFRVGTDFEELIDDFRPVVQEDAVAQARQDIAGLEAVGKEFPEKILPALAQALQQTPEQVGRFISSQSPRSQVQQFLGQFPATAQALQTFPDALGRFQGLTTIFETNLENSDTLNRFGSHRSSGYSLLPVRQCW